MPPFSFVVNGLLGRKESGISTGLTGLCPPRAGGGGEEEPHNDDADGDGGEGGTTVDLGRGMAADSGGGGPPAADQGRPRGGAQGWITQRPVAVVVTPAAADDTAA